MSLTTSCNNSTRALPGIGAAFSWASIGLAVLTAILQGLVTALAFMTESSTRWTFRFRLALVEHIWWTFVSVLLLASLAMSAVAFTSGQGGDPVSVLALSSASFLAVVQYSVPAWQQRRYTRTRWFAWTGESRTAVKREHAGFCRDAIWWAQLVNQNRQQLARLQKTPSDYYGWRIWSAPGLRIDPTDILRVLRAEDIAALDTEKAPPMVGIYTGADPNSSTISLRWGTRQGFGRRVSRAVSSMPLCLLRSSPLTADGYDGKGLTTAMGILGRNKGLQPWKLVFRATSDVTSHMENSSTWAPRPAKVLRSFYRHTLNVQYHGLGEDYVNAAVELALLLVDVPHSVIDHWLALDLEHQCLETNLLLSEKVVPDELYETLSAHYESSYVSMILALNAIQPSQHHTLRSSATDHKRPDLLCTGLLMKARGFSKPSWWNDVDVRRLRDGQNISLSRAVDWQTPAARLLGLSEWPVGFDDSPSQWDGK